MAKIKQLIWKAHCLDRFKVSSCTFLPVTDGRNAFRFFFDVSVPLTGLGIAISTIVLFLSYFGTENSYRPPVLFVLLSSFLMALYGSLIFSLTKPEHDAYHYIHQYKPGSLLTINIAEELKHSDYYFKYKGHIKAVELNNTRGTILIRIKRSGKGNSLKMDQGLFTSEDLSELNGAMNPGAFDFKEAMKRKGINHQLTLDKGQFIEFKKREKSFKTQALIFREKMLESLRKKGFSQEEFSVIEALLLGRRQDLSHETVLNYQNAGAMHLLAISGLHIGILLMILNTILKPIERYRFGKKIKFVFLISFLWFFAFLSGLSPSVIRAVFMFTILTIGLHSGRRNNLSHYLFTALFFSLIINPGYLFDLGFQLSYAAVLSIISLSPLIRSLWNPKHRVLSYCWNLFVISLSAQLGVLPLSLFYFHQFSGLFFLSSLGIIPFLGIILGMGYLITFLNYFDYLPGVLIEIYSWTIRMMNQIIEIIGSLNHLIFRNVFFTLLLCCLSYMFLTTLILWIRHQTGKWALASLLSALIILTSLLVEKGLTQTRASFVVFHQYKESLILNRSGRKGRFYGSLGEENPIKERILSDYQLEHYTLELERSSEFAHFFRTGEKRIMVLDHQAIRSDFGFKPDILVLVNSPKINLDRLLQKVQPDIIVADGSNFFTYKSLWQRTAKKHNIIFHDTTKKGAFTLEQPI